MDFKAFAPMMEPLKSALRVCLLAVAGWSGVVVAPAAEFHRDVAPILREYCAGCHNADDQDGDLSIETYRSLMVGGESGAVVVPGDPDASLMVQALLKQKKPFMPPKKEPQPSAEQVGIIREWIAEGAEAPADDVSILATLVVPHVEPAADAIVPITAIAIAANGRRAVARFGRVVIDEGGELAGLPGKINALEFSLDGKWLAAASGVEGLRGVAIVWNVESGEKLGEFGAGHRDSLYDVAFSPDGRLLATAGYDRLIQLWDLESAKIVRSLRGHNGAVYDVAFSPDGTVLASAGGDDSVKLWNVANGERLDTLGQPEGEEFNVAFTPDGRYVVAAGADKRIYLWQWVSKQFPAINPLSISRFAHEDEIVRLAISPDGSVLASSSADGTLRTWSLPDLQPLEIFDAQPDLLVALQIPPDGQHVIVGRMDGTMQTYAIAERKIGAAALVSDIDGDRHVPSEADVVSIREVEPNQDPKVAMRVPIPAQIAGVISQPGDADLFRFDAKAGEEWVVEVNAARSKSALDSKVSVLTSAGEPIERVRLQAVRESWLTFRGKDSTTSGDFRVHNWRLMELNEFLYINGEVVKLWLYPRGPDSGFNVYPGSGSRRTYFDTTAAAHPLGQPCYTVEPQAPGSDPVPNGLPVFPVYYENDDESQQRWGGDSQLMFTAPGDGEFIAKLEDVRGFGGDGFAYTLAIRPRTPDFTVSVNGELKPSPGSGKEFTVRADRLDGFEGEIRIDLTGIPEGFEATNPVVIEAGQNSAKGVVFAALDAQDPQGEAASASKLTATALIRGEKVTRDVGTFGEIHLGAPSKLRVELPGGELVIAPGETITTSVRLIRDGFDAQVGFGNEDSGRNLPHGVYVDNIGLSGLLVTTGQSEREFMITAAPWVPETTCQFHLLTAAEGGQASRPLTIHVRRK
jgi:WD40 repeat protein